MERGHAILAGTAKGVEHYLYHAQPRMELEELTSDNPESPYFGTISGKSFRLTRGGLRVPAEIYDEYASIFFA